MNDISFFRRDIDYDRYTSVTIVRTNFTVCHVKIKNTSFKCTYP